MRLCAVLASQAQVAVPVLSLDWPNGIRFGTDGDGTRNLPPTVAPASEDCVSLMHYIWRMAAQSW